MVEMMQLLWKKKLNTLASQIGLSSGNDHIEYEPIFAMISPNSGGVDPGVIKLDQKKDFVFCVGIDELHHRVCAAEYQQDKIIENDAKEIYKTFTTNLGLNCDQVKISIASNEHDDCTKEGLRASFVEYAEKVEENGNFIFYFAGHGFEWGDRCVLAPADFDKKGESGISGDELVQWLNDANCKAKNVLFIFDCCYAGDLGERLTYNKTLEINANIFAMCGCGAKESTRSIFGLGHSIFTYFLLDYLNTSECKGEIKIEQAMDVIAEFSFSFSSLLMVLDSSKKLHCGLFNPRLFKSNVGIHQRSITTESGEVMALLQTLFKEPVKEKPHKIIDEWFQFPATQKSLDILSEKASSLEKLQNGIVSVLLYSLALLQYKHSDHDKDNLEKANLFLQIAIKVLREITIFSLEMDHVIIGLEHYISAVKKLDINVSELYVLHEEMEKLNNGSAPTV